MSPWQSILWGLVQGATEFLPVSSSGHLVLIPWFLGWPAPGLAFDAFLHLGTLVAVFIYFRREVGGLIVGWWHSVRAHKIETAEGRLAWLILLSAIPGGLVGYLAGDWFEALFASPRAVSLLLLVTGGILFVGERLGERRVTLAELRWPDALLIGLAQACAVAPGISRSGATIAAGLGRGLRRDDATRFSFLMGLPLIAGAALQQLAKMLSQGLGEGGALALGLGFGAALLSGYGAILLFLRHVRNRSLYPFAYYCWTVGLLGLALAWLRG